MRQRKGLMQYFDSPNQDPSEGPESCPFCDERRVVSAIATNGSVLAIRDLHPVTEGHLLILPRRHTPDLFSMTLEERIQTLELIDTMRCEAQLKDPSILGFNVGVNCGVVAGQTVMHAHIHFIPRRVGDTADPRGGVRGVIPDRMKYR